jgi:hypothetical protein
MGATLWRTKKGRGGRSDGWRHVEVKWGGVRVAAGRTSGGARSRSAVQWRGIGEARQGPVRGGEQGVWATAVCWAGEFGASQ